MVPSSESFPSCAATLRVLDRRFFTRFSAFVLYGRRLSFSFVGLGVEPKNLVIPDDMLWRKLFFGLLLRGSSSVFNRPILLAICVPGVFEASLSWPGVIGVSPPELYSSTTRSGVRSAHLSFWICAGMADGLLKRKCCELAGSRRRGRSGVLNALWALCEGCSRTECEPISRCCVSAGLRCDAGKLLDAKPDSRFFAGTAVVKGELPMGPVWFAHSKSMGVNESRPIATDKTASDAGQRGRERAARGAGVVVALGLATSVTAVAGVNKSCGVRRCAESGCVAVHLKLQVAPRTSLLENFDFGNMGLEVVSCNG